MVTEKIIPSAYGSIAHLPGSRMGVGDKRLNEGQTKILTVKKRDKHDRIIVQEKLDGSCVAVIRKDGYLTCVGRAGYPLVEASYEQHRAFYRWVEKNKPRFEFLQEGERLVGEWMAMAHGIKYNLPHEPFVVFDIVCGTKRILFDEFLMRTKDFIKPRLIHDGDSFSMESLMPHLEKSAHGGEYPEGAVYRVERNGVVDFLGKWVKPEHVCGKYFVEGSTVWNEFPNKEDIICGNNRKDN